MSSFYLKLIAIVTMTIDHVGRIFFPGEELFFIVGRLAFPLFAFLVAKGAMHTKNTKLYLLRLLTFAIISQIPYFLLSRITHIDPWGGNVLFTLFLGLLAITLWEKTSNALLKRVCLFLIIVAAFIFQTDYAGLGVLSVFFFYMFRAYPNKLIISQIAIFSLVGLHSLITDLVEAPGMKIDIWYYLPFAIFSLIFISQYTGKEGPKLKYSFYAFYPVHLLIIYLIKQYG